MKRVDLLPEILGALLGLLLAILSSCSHAKPAPPQVVPVRITAWPEKLSVDCMLPDIPEPPSIPTEDDARLQPDIWARVQVHMRDYIDALTWMGQMRGWAMEMRECVKKLGVAPW